MASRLSLTGFVGFIFQAFQRMSALPYVRMVLLSLHGKAEV